MTMDKVDSDNGYNSDISCDLKYYLKYQITFAIPDNLHN